MAAAAGAGAESRVVINWGDEALRRVKPTEQQLIDARLKTLGNVNGFIDRIIQAMATEDWGAQRELTHPDMPLYALVAYATNRLAKESFFTLVYFWAAGQQNGFVGVQTFTVDKHPVFLLHLLTQQHINRNDKVLKNLQKVFVIMKSKALGEKRFFLFPERASTEGMNRTYALMVNPFTKYSEAGKPEKRFIPSYSLIEAYMTARYPGQCVRGNPVVGLSLPQDIRKNGLEYSRDVGFHFPHVTLPLKPDGIHCPWTDFTTHDGYHWATVCSVPRNHQRAFIAVADLCATDLCLERANTIRASFIAAADLCTTDLCVERGKDKIGSAIASYDADVFGMRKLRADLIDMDAALYLHLDSRDSPSYDREIGAQAEDFFWHFLNEKAMKQELSPHQEARFWTSVSKYVQALPPGESLHLPPEGGFSKLLIYNRLLLEHGKTKRFFSPERMRQIEAIWGMTKAAKQQGVQDPTSLQIAEDTALARVLTTTNYEELLNYSLSAKYPSLTQAIVRYKQKALWSSLVERIMTQMVAVTEAQMPNYKKDALTPLFTLENCLGIFDRSATAKCNPLTQTAMLYIKTHLEALRPTVQFQRYQKESPERCASLLARIAPAAPKPPTT